MTGARQDDLPFSIDDFGLHAEQKNRRAPAGMTADNFGILMQ